MGKISARDLYESHVGTMLETVWTREGEKLQYNPVELRTPLCAVMDAETAGRVEVEELPLDEDSVAKMDWEEIAALVLQLKQERDDTRATTLHTVLNFLFADGPNPLRVSERAFILARALGPTNVWNMRQWEAGAMHGLIRATWQQMEKRLIEEMASRLASNGAFTMPGGKSHAARQRYSADKKGNTSRKHGRRQGDEKRKPEAPEETEMSVPRRAEARRQADLHERKRMAALVGCRPDDLDLSKITPTRDT